MKGQSTKLKQAIKLLGYRQVELAAKLGMHPSRFSLYVNGWTKPNKEVQHQIANLLGIEAKKLFPG